MTSHSGSQHRVADSSGIQWAAVISAAVAWSSKPAPAIDLPARRVVVVGGYTVERGFFQKTACVRGGVLILQSESMHGF